MAMLVLVLLCLGFTPAAATANWGQTYYNGAHTGFNPAEKTLGAGNVGSLQLLWSANISGFVNSFAVNNGVVYATGDNTYNLVALNASTGTQLWSANLGNNPPDNATIAFGKGLVFEQCQFSDQGGTGYGAIWAYKASTGKLVWQFSNPCQCLPEAQVMEPPVYNAGVLYCGYSSGGGVQNHSVCSGCGDGRRALDVRGHGQQLRRWTSSLWGRQRLPRLGR